MQFLPFRQHVNDAGQLQHEQGHHVERIVVAGIEHIDGPYVDVMDVIAPSNRVFVQTMEMPTQTDIFLHTQNIANDRHIFLWTQMLSFARRPNWKDFSVVLIEDVRLIG